MIKLLIAFLSLVMLTSCAQTQTLTPQVSAGLPSLVSPTQLSVTPTAASPKSSDMHINIECLNIETTLPPDINSNGILLLSDQAVGSDGLYKNQVHPQFVGHNSKRLCREAF